MGTRKREGYIMGSGDAWGSACTGNHGSARAQQARMSREANDIAGATGLRVITPGSGGADGRAIDELEVYAVPEPGSALLALTGLATMISRGRRN